MSMEQIELLFDYIVGLNGLFDFDIESLIQTRDITNYTPKVKQFTPKRKFINLITSESTQQINTQGDYLKEICKQQNDSWMHKFKLQEQALKQLQQQVKEMPSQENLYEIQIELRKNQNSCQQNSSLIETNFNNKFEELGATFNNYLKTIDFSELFDQSITDYITKLQSRFAPKEFTFQKMNALECQFNHLNEQLLELKRFTNTNISQILTKQNFILSDLTTTVKQHEYQQLVQQSYQFITQQHLNQFSEQIFPLLEELKKQMSASQDSIENFRGIIKRTDYDLLQKATKMDWQIQRKEHEELRANNAQMQQKLTATTSEISSFYDYYDTQKQKMGSDLTQQIISSMENVIKEQVIKQMEQYNLSEVSQQLERLRDFMKQKANKMDILDSLNLKSNKADFTGLESKVNSALHMFKSQIKVISEFMELFGSDTDIESMNFKKNTIQKLIFESNSISGNFSKLCSTQSNFKQESESPQTARQLSCRQKFNTSPKSNGVKLFLRPLLSNTFSVQQSKRNKVNTSMIY